MSALGAFVGNLAASLRAGDILYSGCRAGDFAPPRGARACFASPDPAQLAACMESSRAEFAQAGSASLPWPDGEFDMVVSRDLGAGGACEALRVSRAYVASFEGRGSGAARIWGGAGVRTISDVRVHPDIDASEPRFVLVCKEPRGGRADQAGDLEGPQEKAAPA